MTQYAISLQEGEYTPYSLRQLRRDNPHISFPKNPSAELLAEFGVYIVEDAPPEDIDPDEEDLGEVEITKKEGRVVRRAKRRALTREERRARRRLRREQREQAVARDLAVTVLPVLIKHALGDATDDELRAALLEVQEVHDV